MNPPSGKENRGMMPLMAKGRLDPAWTEIRERDNLDLDPAGRI
jgi:hypothetical protein